MMSVSFSFIINDLWGDTCSEFNQNVLSCDWQCQVNDDGSLASFSILRLDFLPEVHIVFHVSQIDTLVIIDVESDLFGEFISAELILINHDLLNLICLVKFVNVATVSELSFYLQVLCPLHLERKSLLRETFWASLTLKHIRITDLVPTVTHCL